MKNAILILLLVIASPQAWAQYIDWTPVCGTDTITVDYRGHRGPVHYKAFECTKVGKLGIRIDAGVNSYRYSDRTRRWLGDHNGGAVGLALAHGHYSLGAWFKVSTVNTRKSVLYNGQDLPGGTRMNPVKIQYEFSYSFNFKYNFSVEPYIGLTSNSFHVFNLDTLVRTYPVLKVKGAAAGLTLNKYFRMQKLEYIAVFFKYGYGFTNFKRVNRELGRGYHDISFGLAFKAFGKQNFHKRI